MSCKFYYLHYVFTLLSEFHIHLGYEYQEIGRSFTPLRIFRCWWSPNAIHCMALLVSGYCMTNGVKSTLVWLLIHRKSWIREYFFLLYATGQCKIKTRKTKIWEKIHIQTACHNLNCFVLRISISCLSVNVCLISLISQLWVKNLW